MEKYHLRYAQSADLPAIVDIFNQAIAAGNINDETKPQTFEERLDWFSQFNSQMPIWVLLDPHEKVIGWVSLEPFYNHPAYCYSAEISIYLDNNYQHRQLGQQMLKYVDKQIQQSLNIQTVVAYIYQRNQASQHLFAKCGYQHCGWLPQIAFLNGELLSLEIYCKHF